MNWGRSIFLAFVLFAAFIGTLVYICVRQDISLVSDTYYADELAYENQLDRIRNAQALSSRPEIVVSGDSLRIRFADFPLVNNGMVKLFRPSNPAFDRTFPIKTGSDTTRWFPVSGLPHGMYKVKLDWSMNGLEFYQEEIINL